MAPSSYQAPNKGDKQNERTQSQSSKSNLAVGATTVATILKHKGSTVYAVGPDDTVSAAVALLKEKRIGALLVTDGNSNLVGILSERDIVRRLAETPGQTLPQRVADLMTENVVSCAPDDALITVLEKMTEGRFRHMPVLSEGKLAGMITIGDAVSQRLKELEYESLQMRQMIVG